MACGLAAPKPRTASPIDGSPCHSGGLRAHRRSAPRFGLGRESGRSSDQRCEVTGRGAGGAAPPELSRHSIETRSPQAPNDLVIAARATRRENVWRAAERAPEAAATRWARSAAERAEGLIVGAESLAWAFGRVASLVVWEVGTIAAIVATADVQLVYRPTEVGSGIAQAAAAPACLHIAKREGSTRRSSSATPIQLRQRRESPAQRSVTRGRSTLPPRVSAIGNDSVIIEARLRRCRSASMKMRRPR